MFRPHLDVFIDVCGLLEEEKMKTDTKLIVVMGSQIFFIGSLQRHLAAISGSDLRRSRTVNKIWRIKRKKKNLSVNHYNTALTQADRLGNKAK